MTSPSTFVVDASEVEDEGKEDGDKDADEDADKDKDDMSAAAVFNAVV